VIWNAGRFAANVSSRRMLSIRNSVVRSVNDASAIELPNTS
jgi:hypothetical protein